LEVGAGSGQLSKGGFYATYTDPESDNWTLTVVKIDEDHAPCTRPALPAFNVSDETVTFKLAPHMKTKGISVWYSNFEAYNPDGTVDQVFERQADLKIIDGSFSISVPIGSFYTISTIQKGPTKGLPETPIPKSEPSLPLPLYQDFEGILTSQEAPWWADQIGAWEVHYENASASNKVMRQMVPELPIGWSDHGGNGPMTLLGMREWQDIQITAKFLLPQNLTRVPHACLGSRVDQMWADGIVFCVGADGAWTLTVGGPNLGGNEFKGTMYTNGSTVAPVKESWSTIKLTTIGDKASGSVNGAQLFSDVTIRNLDTGFAALGAGDWYSIAFDDVGIEQAGPNWKPTSPCGAPMIGSIVSVRDCAANGVTVDDEAFELLADWGIRHVKSGLCAAVKNAASGTGLTLQKCNPKDLHQQFKNDYTNVRNTVVPFKLKAATYLNSDSDSDSDSDSNSDSDCDCDS